MAVKILASPIHGAGDPAIDVKDPAFIAEKTKRMDERHDPLRENSKWSLPPISNATVPAMVVEDHLTGKLVPAPQDLSVPLEMGVVYEVRAQVVMFLQNISDNEDDILEFSRHGDPDGNWARLYPSSIVKFEGTLFLLNRTHMENMKVAFIEEE